VRLLKLWTTTYGKSDSASQANNYFCRDFASDRSNRKTDASQEAVQSSEGNIKYNIGTAGDEDVAQQCAKDDRTASLGALLIGDSLSQSFDCPLQPALIEIRDHRAHNEAGSYRPAEERQANHNSYAAEQQQEFADSCQGAIEKSIREEGGRLRRRSGHQITVSQINSSAA
jgi:hypothetical protein